MRHVIDHIQLSVEDYPRAKAFYVAALKPLGFTLMMEFPEGQTPLYGGLGAEGKPFLWIGAGARQTPPTHIAFGVNTRPEVDAFYTAALAAGGTDNGPPGVRLDYHPKYYAAYVRDPEGHNIEAVCQALPGAAKAASPRKRAAKRAARKAPVKQTRKARPARGKKAAARKAPARKVSARKAPARRRKKK
jgi:catechol 2,3-dioxygenase-like lactoylglutathione lyase family enzyme